MGKRTGGKNADPISQKTAVELDVASKIDGPIGRLMKLQRSLLFAEISMLSYLPDHEAQPVFENVGFTHVRYVERDGQPARRFQRQHRQQQHGEHRHLRRQQGGGARADDAAPAADDDAGDDDDHDE